MSQHGNQFSYTPTVCHPERLKKIADSRREPKDHHIECLLCGWNVRRFFDVLRLLRMTQTGLKRIF